MSEPKAWRLWIDDEERTDECDGLDFGIPSLLYDTTRHTGARRSTLGPRGFWIKLTNPGEVLRALVDGGQQVHQLKLLFGDQALLVPVRFHEEWVEESGVRRMFGCLAYDPHDGPQWVTEPNSDGGRRPLTLAAKEG